MNSTSSPNTVHPDNTQLDQLRAGLLDHQPAIKLQLLAHLQACNACHRRATDLNRLIAIQRDHADPRLAQQLRSRRMTALMDGAVQHPRRTLTRRLAPAFALATVVAVMIGIGGFLEINPAPPPPALTQTSSDTVPDLYADIDFYLWLSNHPATENTDADRS